MTTPKNKEGEFEMGEDIRSGEFVPIEVVKSNPDRYRVIKMSPDIRINRLRDLIYEPEHEKAPCWCNPSFIKKGGKMHIIHNTQRDVITAFVKSNFK